MKLKIKNPIKTRGPLDFLGVAFAGIFTESLGGAPGSALDVNNVLAIFRGLSCWFIRFGIIATGVMMIVYGILFLISKGNPTSFSNARKALGWGIVGGLVIFGVFTIVLTIPELLEVGSDEEIDYPIDKILKSCL